MRRDTTLRSFLGLLLALLIPAGAAFAQTATVRGIVVDQNGDPLPGASVRVEGNEQIGASTNVDGEYEIVSMPLGQSTLLATFVGFNEASADVDLVEGEVAVVNFELFTGVELEGISVDALGFATNKDDLATSQTSVAGDAIQRSGETSVLRALAAKAPGINVSASGGDPGSSTRIVIRGQNSIQGDNQPLIVIDGQPVFNTSGGATDGVQQASRLNDLNPEDILSVEVLRSASAAALWGSRAQAGVIVITTKKGQTGRAGRPAVSFSTRLSVDDINQEVPLQTDFGQGTDGFYQFTPTAGWSWGDKLSLREGGADVFNTDGAFAEGLVTGQRYYPISSGFYGDPHGGKRSQEVFDTFGTLFEDGVYLDNNLTVSGSDDNGRYFLSGGFLSQDGIIVENSNLERASFRLNAERNLSSRVTVSAQGSYVRSTSDRIQQGSNLSGLLLGGLRNSVDFNVDDYLVNYYPDGEDGPFIAQRQRAYRNPLGANAGSIYDNPLFVVNRNLNEESINRFLGQTEARYQALDWLNLSARVGADYYTDRTFVYFPVYSAANSSGAQSESNSSFFQLNGDLIARAERDITDDIGASLLLGFNLNHRETDFVGSSLTSFTLPIFPFGDEDPYRSLSNAEAADVTGTTGQSVRRTLGFYGETGFDLYDQLFLNFTGRIDQASTFGPEADDNFFYPSASVAWQFSELLGDNAGPLSFGKLRASYGEVGAEPDPYLAGTYFFPQSVGDGYTDFAVLDASAYGGGFARSARLPSAVIAPERKVETEVGADFRLFGDRVSLGAVYYDNETDNAIFNVDVAPSIGYTVQTANAATISNEGVELSLDVAWPNLGDFGWNTYASWWTNENTVVDLAGVTEFSLNGFTSLTSSLVEDEPFGVLYGNRWRRAEAGCTETTPRVVCEPLTDAEVAAGFTVAPDERVLDPDGFPIQANQQGIVGDPNPDWRASIGNTLRFKDLSLNALFDFSIGGDVWNGTAGALSYFGRSGYQDWWTTISEDEANNLTDYFGLTVAERCEGASAPVVFGADQPDGFGGAGNCAVADVTNNGDGTYTFRGFVEDFGGGPVIVNQYYYWSGPGSGFTGPSEPFIEDASFVRLREVTLSYNWRDQLVQRLGISSINIALTGRNLWLSTDYTGVDPETNLTGPSNGQGLDYFNNPATRSYQVSLRFTY